VLPRGTHQWRRFVRPDELHHAAAGAGLAHIDLRGMRYLPVLHRASWVDDASVNYISAYRRPVDATPATASAAAR
jgi:2-polyprenyl-6-hydroxyphenyl methylase/3-demethylubiquinone-9 3-methyltransferase